MRWNNAIQKAIIEEWTEGVQSARGPRARQTLRKRLGKKYGLSIHLIQGIIELGAAQGLNRMSVEAEKQDGRRWTPINYHELIGDLKERVEALERKFDYLLDGIQKVLDDGETMAIHLQHLRQMGRWMKGRKAIELEGSSPLRLKK